ncbi:MAG: hypothetical protein GXO42_00975 [bacterium]|nr:hypothetical protein [bacterium]
MLRVYPASSKFIKYLLANLLAYAILLATAGFCFGAQFFSLLFILVLQPLLVIIFEQVTARLAEPVLGVVESRYFLIVYLLCYAEAATLRYGWCLPLVYFSLACLFNVIEYRILRPVHDE